MRSIAEALASIPPKEDPFTLLAELSADALLLRRLEIADMLQQLEEERKEIDAELMVTSSEAELRFGVELGGGWHLKQCHLTSWA